MSHQTMRKPVQWLCVAFLLSVFLYNCEQTPTASAEPAADTAEASNTIALSLADFTSSEGEFTTTDSTVALSAGENGWLAYTLDVPVAGRYRVNVTATGPDSTAAVWIEDYVNNKDGRTYNITGSMGLLGKESVTIDGSPLHAGQHPIKVHLEGAGTSVSAVEFELLIEHQLTPKTLTQDMDGEEWEIVWADEFDGSGIPDTSKWTFDLGNWGWGNNELQYYTDFRPKNARQENGNLIIESHKEDMGQAWTSARLTTRGKVSFTYGKIEFRAKVPPKRGNWAAGWTLGDSYVDEISWPYCGEIDIMESVGFEMDDETGNGEAHASVHCGAYYFKLGNHHTGTIEVENMHETFHTYGVIWTPEGITAYVDDQAYFTYDDTSTELAWPFDQPQNIILNLAMGGGWGGAEGMDETMTSQQIVVDYVRVYGKR
ncbi:MAG: family 16 glycosylhydrolase [Bacteroidota bacterium]